MTAPLLVSPRQSSQPRLPPQANLLVAVMVLAASVCETRPTAQTVAAEPAHEISRLQNEKLTFGLVLRRGYPTDTTKWLVTLKT